MEQDLTQQPEELKAKAEEYLNGWKRERADFLNYKKDEGERNTQMLDYARRETVLRVLPVIDTMELAQKTLPEDLKANEWSKGFMQIQKQVEEFLKGQGAEAIKTVGEPFDPSYMEAVEEEEGELSGVVTSELQKGYTMNGKLIRPAKVKISK